MDSEVKKEWRKHRQRWLDRMNLFKQKYESIDNGIHQILDDIDEQNITDIRHVYDRLESLSKAVQANEKFT